MLPGSPLFQNALDEFRQIRRRTFYPKTDLALPRPELAQQLERRPELLRQLQEPARLAIQTLLGESVIELEPKPGIGTFHLLYHAQFEGPHPPVYLRAEYVFSQRPGYEFLIEEQLQPILKQYSIPLPDLLAADFSRSVFPLDFQIRREAAGTRLTEIENPETQFIPDAILVNLGRQLAQLHTIPATGAGLLDPAALLKPTPQVQGLLTHWNDYLTLNLDAHLHTCEAIHAITPEERSLIWKIFQNEIPALRGVPIKLLHGDPGHHNIFVLDQDISSILDWEDALAGDPIFDIAYWGTFVRDHQLEIFLRGYQEISPSLPEFKQKFWLYYLRIALSKTVHRHLFGVRERPGRPPASRRVQKALSHLTELV